MAMERLPLAPGLVTGVVMVSLFALIRDSSALGSGITMASVLLGGYSLRLDAQARSAGFRLLAQERAAREAEATSAALAERARIAARSTTSSRTASPHSSYIWRRPGCRSTGARKGRSANRSWSGWWPPG
jgi:hypothetical protein